ncbi:MAG: homocysteine S-methyltransferase family protein [Chitinispirillales bacterium]|jgi:5-methyltetrahydrofolate--homocysteine methyltransferase|nr:homocysteine S-methyltransferase family protein [Chitinispirillales bacterium]
MRKYLEMIDNREPVIFDGALGTEIQKAEPTEGDFGGYSGCNEYLNISRPDIIEAIHIKYLESGANAIETNTFGGSRTKLGEFGLEDRVREINKAAAQIARRAIEKAGGGSDKPRFVCGSIGPTGFLPSSGDSELSSVNFDQLVDIYTEQVLGLVDGGADILLIETSQDLLEVRAVILAVRRLLSSSPKRIPLQAQVTMDAGGKMLLGSDVAAFLGAVQGMGVDVVGLNCSSGPDEMGPCIDELLKLSTLPVSMLPNAGLPSNVDGKAVYKMGPQEFADKMLAFVKGKGVSVVGGCCGTTPAHIRALAGAISGINVAKRDNSRRGCFLSTGISGLDLEQARRPIIIGERLNTQGSKKTKEFVIGRNFEELYYIAKEQIDKNSTLLDICVAANELDVGEAEMMGSVVAYLRERVGIPFCIDTTEPSVMEAALKKSPGSVLINSINLEHGGAKARKILPLAAEFGCPVVALTIDDAGMAATADRKLEVADRLIKLACDEYKLPKHYVYIDPLVFTLATGDVDTANAALETLDALRRIKKEFPNVRTAMGVSNVSFGLAPKARRILNNLMLHYAVDAGLSAAIFNPLHVDDVNAYDKTVRGLGEDLLFNRHPDCLQKFVEYFEAEGQRTAHSAQRTAGGAHGAADLPPEQRLRSAIIDRDKRHLPEIIDKLLESRPAPDILNTILLPAMSEVGELMAAGSMILPFVLQAAEAMREAVAILEPHLKASGGGAVKGKIVIATVYGDVHDIGKNLVASILRNQGFDVIDLGKQVAIETIVEAVRREKPDAVGLSALLVTTSKQMGECVKTFAQLDINTPIIIGGAAVNREFALRIAVLEDGKKFAPGVHYAKDAFDVVKIFDAMDGRSDGKGVLLDGQVTAVNDDKKSSGKTIINIDDTSKASKTSTPASTTKSTRKALKYDYLIEPPFHGTGEILVWDTPALLAAVDREQLFKTRWGGGNLDAGSYASARQEEFGPVFDRLSYEIINESLIDARGFYGFFPVIADGEKISFLDPSDYHTERLTFGFPRSAKSGLSLADYVRPEGDIVSTQAVTISARIGERCRELLLEHDRYSDGYYLNGLANYLVEAVADKLSAEIRRALGLGKGAGRRYSFGYQGMPSLEDQARLLEFLGVEERLGISLTPGFQMQPEHSTVAIFVHHPDAEYLS